MVAIIGSVGTIAYNNKSDFDYWVCINRRTTTSEKYDAFRQKVLAVQKWAEAELKLPVHLFVNDVESVRNNIFDEDEDEAFGSAVGALLKDEFYRSSIVVAGKIPFWWVIPQFTRDAEYELLYARLTDEEREQQYVNLGNLYSINKDDFIGAALFQIIKSLGNPFKSIIKLGVLEKYLFESEEVPLISQKVRINVQRGNIPNTILDSYLLMFEEVFEYYQKYLKDEASLTILRQNLYLKINPQLSKYATIRDRSSIPYKVEEMLRSAAKWGWNEDLIRELDAFDSWDYTRVMKFWDQVQAFMLKSYQRISVPFPP
jgi:adenylate cyclase class 1